jgi:hypothetical protein
MYISTHSLTSALDGGELPASHSGRFTPRERASVSHWIGGWVSPRAVMDVVVKSKIPSSRRKSNPRTPIVQPEENMYSLLHKNFPFFFTTHHATFLLILIHYCSNMHICFHYKLSELVSATITHQNIEEMITFVY